MKQKKLLLVLLVIATFSIQSIVLNRANVSAETCHNTSSYGSVTLNIPELGDRDNRLVWVRMKVPEPNKKVLLQVNSADCFEVSAQDTDNWIWATYSPDGYSQVINFPDNSGNTIKVIGVNSGVKVDRILVTGSECTPVGFGTNCQGSTAETAEAPDNATAIQSKTVSPISGKVVISDTPSSNSDNLKQLTYSSSGRMLQNSSTPEPFNSILLPNGRHTVYVITTLKDGKEISEYAEIEVNNSENPFTPSYRWFLLNKNSVLLITLSMIVVGSVVVAARLTVSYAKKRRERNFRGL